MIPKPVNDPNFWIEELAPLLREVDFALRLAVPRAHSFFIDFHKKPINRPVLSNLIRYHALEYLWSRGFEATDEAEQSDDDEWNLRGLPNNGIELRYKQSCIRIRKGIDPPYPTTTASQDFYQQKLFEESDGDVVTNLLVMFNLDDELQYDGKLKLMRPTRLNVRRKMVKCEWSKTVEISAIDLRRAIAPEYLNDGDLPLSEQDGSEEKDRKRDTGTDGTTNDAN